MQTVSYDLPSLLRARGPSPSRWQLMPSRDGVLRSHRSLIVWRSVCGLLAALVALIAHAERAEAQSVEWQVHEGEVIQIVSLNSARIYRICLYSEMFGVKTTFEPTVRTLAGVHELKLAHSPNTVRCIDIEAKRIEIVGGRNASDPKKVAFGTYELIP